MYRLRATARRLVSSVSGIWAPKYRVAWCGHKVRRDDFGDQRVQIMTEDGRAWYQGLYRCGDVWLCPQCSGKIASGRATELGESVIEAARQGMAGAMITYTFPHYRADDLELLVKKFAKARSKLRACRAWKRFTTRWGIAGEVKALEVTTGKNGWHPHAHNLTFFDREIPESKRAEFESDLYDAWKTACIRADLPSPSREHGVHVLWFPDASAMAADYVAGWSAIQELTGQARKEAGEHGRNAWQLLEDASAGDEAAGGLWLQYVKVFHGRQQLRWSKGLRNRLKRIDLFDADLLEDGTEAAQRMVMLGPDQWQVICRARAQEWVLCIAELEGSEAVHGAINALLTSVPMQGGGYAQRLE